MDVPGKVLITGGTSGLGLELVKSFLKRDFFVVTTGRRIINLPDFNDRLRLFRVDFADLRQTSDIFNQICKIYDFDYVIYNAGILSPPHFISTNDGFEYTYQVNFLAHLLANEIIIRHHSSGRSLRIAAVTSMAYRLAEHEFNPFRGPSVYRAWKAYSDSKLYLALMCLYYSNKLAETNIRYFSFDPGIFGSELYRTQAKIFRKIYQIGIHILKNPASSAVILSDIMVGYDIKNGAVYDKKKRIRKLTEPAFSVNETFWTKAFNEICLYLK